MNPFFCLNNFLRLRLLLFTSLLYRGFLYLLLLGCQARFLNRRRRLVGLLRGWRRVILGRGRKRLALRRLDRLSALLLGVRVRVRLAGRLLRLRLAGRLLRLRLLWRTLSRGGKPVELV